MTAMVRRCMNGESTQSQHTSTENTLIAVMHFGGDDIDAAALLVLAEHAQL